MYSSLIVYIMFSVIIFLSIYIQYTKFDLNKADVFPFIGEQKSQNVQSLSSMMTMANCFQQNIRCTVERDCSTCLNTELDWYCNKDVGICLPRDVVGCEKSCHRKYGTFVIEKKAVSVLDGANKTNKVQYECNCKCTDMYHYGTSCNMLKFNVRAFDSVNNQIYCKPKHIPYNLQLNYNTKLGVCFPEHMKDVLNSQLHIKPSSQW